MSVLHSPIHTLICIHLQVEMNPDPTAYRHGKPVDQSSTGSDQGAPYNYSNHHQQQQQHHHQQQQQHRHHQATKPSRPVGGKPQPQYSNQGYSPDAQETDIDGDLAGPRPQQPHRQMQDYGYGGYDAFDQSAGSIGGIGGIGGIAGGGALGSPGSAMGTPPRGVPQSFSQHSPQQPVQQQQQPRTRWGSKSPRTPQPTGAGVMNAGYAQEAVSTVSEQYQQAQQQYASPEAAMTPGGHHYTSYAHSEAPAPQVPSSSTEV